LDGVLSLSHKKIHAEGNSDKAKLGTGIGFSCLSLWWLAKGRGAGTQGNYAFIPSFHINCVGGTLNWVFMIDSKPQLKKCFSNTHQLKKAFM
jgi:hypothetical protein